MATLAAVKLENVWGERVTARRSALGFSQRQLAELAGTTQATVWKVEHGKITPRDSLKIAIGRALGDDPARLFSLGVAQ